MRLKSSLFLLLGLFFFISTFGQEDIIEAKLKECINEKINYHIQEKYGKDPFDFYEFILKVEFEFQQNGVLNDLSKKSYSSLLDEITKRKKRKFKRVFQKQSLLIDSYGFDSFSTENIFNQCPYRVSVDFKESDGKLIYDQASILYRIMKVEYYDEKLLKELFSLVDEKSFSKIIYRAPIIVLVMINLDYKYNREFIKRRRQLRGKPIFGNQTNQKNKK